MPLFGGRGCREGVLGCVLLEFVIDELVTGERGVDAVESVAGETKEGLFAAHLGEFLGYS